MTTKWGERARAVYEEGVAERGNWQPRAGSWTHKQYVYWLARTPHKPEGRENFCHFWRVALFWATLYRIRTGWMKIAGPVAKIFSVVGIAMLAIALGVALYMMVTNPEAVAIALLTTVAGFGIIVVMATVMIMVMPKEKWEDAPAPKHNRKIAIGLMVLGAPVALVVGLAGGIVYGILRVIFAISESPRGREYAKNIGLFLVVTGALVLLAAIMVEAGWKNSLLGVGLIIAAMAVIAGFLLLADVIAGRRRRLEREREEAKRDADRKLREWIQSLSQDELAAYYAKQTKDWEDREARLQQQVDQRRERKVARKNRMQSAGDLVIFFAQVVRVKKWGICPFVDVPDMDGARKDEHNGRIAA